MKSRRQYLAMARLAAVMSVLMVALSDEGA
jgi:hypothetical protein